MNNERAVSTSWVWYRPVRLRTRALGSAAAAPMSVTVSYPVERDVTDYADFTGRTAAVDSVEVRARVSGYLDTVNFKEGALVKKDDKLFEIDPRPYRAELDRAKGTLAQIDARVRRLERDYHRAKNLIVRGAVGQEEYDRYEADYREAVAGLDVAKANRDLAALNVEYANVTAPVSGRVSRYVVTVGNLIQSGDQNSGTLLTTIVSVDPMYAQGQAHFRQSWRFRVLAPDRFICIPFSVWRHSRRRTENNRWRTVSIFPWMRSYCILRSWRILAPPSIGDIRWSVWSSSL